MKIILVALWARMGGKGIYYIGSTDWLVSDICIFSSNGIACDISSYSWSHQLIKFTTIHYYFCKIHLFCTAQIKLLNGDMIGITTLANLKFLMVALISIIHSEKQYCFQFTSYLVKHNYNGFC